MRVQRLHPLRCGCLREMGVVLPISLTVYLGRPLCPRGLYPYPLVPACPHSLSAVRTVMRMHLLHTFFAYAWPIHHVPSLLRSHALAQCAAQCAHASSRSRQDRRGWAVLPHGPVASAARFSPSISIERAGTHRAANAQVIPTLLRQLPKAHGPPSSLSALSCSSAHRHYLPQLRCCSTQRRMTSFQGQARIGSKT
ncbi:hypothetical protein B0H21DRAFT_73204 [Amylocystis lapponica]|nr:hypothetical protein B0H21DRAFT_141358 [Amylocystis lapponica]KAH9949892.1 hypothetical protein B0H21DRAFT_73204 [Amylocystis lapponica]